MKVKIIQTTLNQDVWYKNYIDNIFEVKESENNSKEFYTLISIDEYKDNSFFQNIDYFKYHILKSDCNIIEE